VLNINTYKISILNMIMKTSTKVIIVVAILLAVVLVWGLIGSSESAKIGTTCDFGIGEKTGLGESGSALCWKWHRNTVGQIGDDLNDLFGEE
jgi:hypothetical protein